MLYLIIGFVCLCVAFGMNLMRRWLPAALTLYFLAATLIYAGFTGQP